MAKEKPTVSEQQIRKPKPVIIEKQQKRKPKPAKPKKD